ncbi:MAG: substrate-binding domain-containing protein [Oscillibacter sp.]|nr:substrate-binding domain-containing protein [Oscillibacter sp.]
MSAYTVPTLTTLAQPQAELGEQSVRILVDMIEGRGGNRHVQVDTAPRSGGSVRRLDA